jgi:ParB/RepB/Spo0J family partition protein
MPASHQSRYKERYDKLLDDSLAVVQPRDFSSEELAQTAEDAFKRVPGAVMVPVERIEPNPDNPRHGRDDAAMEPLAASIAERGLLQPLVVRRDADRPGYYVVIAGSRRLLAARLVRGDPDAAVRTRVAHLPCIIKDVSDRDAFADALLENLARADLSRAETMDALLRLHRDYGWSGNQISRRIGRSQGDVSELLAIAQDAELSDLVREDKVRPSTATIIKRMPKETRAATIADLQAGKALTIDEARRHTSLRLGIGTARDLTA